jgi:hypothetical protein
MPNAAEQSLSDLYIMDFPYETYTATGERRTGMLCQMPMKLSQRLQLKEFTTLTPVVGVGSSRWQRGAMKRRPRWL